VKKTTDMISVIANPEHLLDQIGDSRAGPQFSRKAMRNRPLRQGFSQLLLSLVTEARRPTWSWLRPNPLHTLLSKGGLPPPNTTTVNTDDSSNLNGWLSLLQ
jgi:hypothetical protein